MIQKNVYLSSCKVPLLFWSDVNKIWTFSTDFRKIFTYQTSRKSVQLEPSCSMRENGQTDRHGEANIGFSQFCYRAFKLVSTFRRYFSRPTNRVDDGPQPDVSESCSVPIIGAAGFYSMNHVNRHPEKTSVSLKAIRYSDLTYLALCLF